MFSYNYILAVLAVISVSFYLIKAWNNTTLPILVTKLISRIGFIKKQNTETLKEVYSRDDWQLWASVLLPDLAVHWLNCFICQTPYITAFFSWLILYKFCNFSLNFSILGWLISLAPVIKLNESATSYDGSETHFKNNLEVKKVKISKFNLPENLATHEGPLEQQSSEVTHVVQKKLDQKLQEFKDNMKGKLENLSAALSETKEQTIQASQNLVKNKMELINETAKKNLELVHNNYELWHKEMGIQTQAGPNGENLIMGFNPILLETMKFFKPEEPCFFPGCEELRTQHAEELNAKGASCPGCVKSEIQRKYMILVKRAIEAHKSQQA